MSKGTAVRLALIAVFSLIIASIAVAAEKKGDSVAVEVTTGSLNQCVAVQSGKVTDRAIKLQGALPVLCGTIAEDKVAYCAANQNYIPGKDPSFTIDSDGDSNISLVGTEDPSFSLTVVIEAKKNGNGIAVLILNDTNGNGIFCTGEVVERETRTAKRVQPTKQPTKPSTPTLDL